MKQEPLSTAYISLKKVVFTYSYELRQTSFCHQNAKANLFRKRQIVSFTTLSLGTVETSQDYHHLSAMDENGTGRLSSNRSDVLRAELTSW